jgi:hypothetical protein
MKKDKIIPDDIARLKGTDQRFSGWRKAGLSGNNGSCVEVGSGKDAYSGFIGVRDSKNPDGPALAFTPKEWTAFLDGARKGEFDR